MAIGAANARPFKLIAFGDSLTAGYLLPNAQAFPAVLERVLTGRGHAVEIINGGVSGDTTTAGLDRLDWTIPDDADGVLLELGANDALRGLDPAIPRKALGEILLRLQARKIKVLLLGMKAPPNLGSDYVRAFDAIYPDLASSYGVPLYPFFLKGVIDQPRLIQPDGLHPTGAGVDVIVNEMLPTVEAFLGTLP